jgi:hypothetical protein
MPNTLAGLGCLNLWGLGVIFNCSRVFVVIIQSVG